VKTLASGQTHALAAALRHCQLWSWQLLLQRPCVVSGGLCAPSAKRWCHRQCPLVPGDTRHPLASVHADPALWGHLSLT
jgi:hypothetical protein